MTAPGNLRQYIPTGQRLYSLLAIVAIVVIALGYILFAWASILPQFAARDVLQSQLASAEQKLAESRRSQAKSPDQLKAQIATAQASLNQATQVFLTDSQAAAALNNLYTYANQSGVSITNLLAQPPSGTGKGAYDARMFRLQAQGPVPNLARFVASIQEAAFPGYVIGNVTIAQGSQAPLLTMDVTLYTSPYSSGAVAVATPYVPANPMPSTSTQVPPLTVEQQLYRQLDSAWAVGDWATSIRLIDQILQINPTSADATQKLYAALVNYGRQFAAAGRLDEAKTAFSRALAVNPTGGEAAAGLQALTGGVPQATLPSQQTVHVVRAGDTLYSIARRYGTTFQAVMAANGLTSYNILVGQQLVIPAR